MKTPKFKKPFTATLRGHLNDMNNPGLGYTRMGTQLGTAMLDDGRTVYFYLFTTTDQLELKPPEAKEERPA